MFFTSTDPLAVKFISAASINDGTKLIINWTEPDDSETGPITGYELEMRTGRTF